MTNKFLHASQTHIVVSCPASAASILSPTPEHGGFGIASDAADMGTAVHLVAKHVVDGTSVRNRNIAMAYGIDPESDDWRYLVGRVYALWDDSLRRYFQSPRTEVPMSLERENYTLTGTVDVLSVCGDEVRIADWKSGRHEGDTSQQLLSYAAMALAANPGTTRAYVVTAWLRADSTEAKYADREAVDLWLDRIDGALKRHDEYRAGDQCVYCPRRHNCPELRAAAHDLAETPDSDLVTADVVAQAYRTLKALSGRIRTAEAAVKAWVFENGRLPLGDGYELAVAERKGTVVRFVPAVEWLMDNYPDEWTGAVTIRKGALETIIRNAAERGRKQEAVEEAWEVLEKLGALDHTWTQALTRRKQKETTE